MQQFQYEAFRRQVEMMLRQVPAVSLMLFFALAIGGAHHILAIIIHLRRYGSRSGDVEFLLQER